ncbi:hypothetical protein [Saccharopolyspora griseoalba]|uniref:Uncharacterized protein n=1 Tax=Saccharopolyspora griseoalba TaxID=1431848 RepID=A0ABW2LTN1_9PSEU
MGFVVLALVLAALIVRPPVIEAFTELRGNESGASQRRHEERMAKMRYEHERWQEKVRERRVRRQRGDKTIGQALQNRLARWIEGYDEKIASLDDLLDADGNPNAGFFGRYGAAFTTAWRRRRQRRHARFRSWATWAEERLQQRFERNATGGDTTGPVDDSTSVHDAYGGTYSAKGGASSTDDTSPEGEDLGVQWAEATRLDRENADEPEQDAAPPLALPPGLVAREPLSAPTCQRCGSKGPDVTLRLFTQSRMYETTSYLCDSCQKLVEQRQEELTAVMPDEGIEDAVVEQDNDQHSKEDVGANLDSTDPNHDGNVIELFPKEGRNMSAPTADSSNAIHVESGQIIGPTTGKGFTSSVSGLLVQLNQQVQLAAEQMKSAEIDPEQVAQMEKVFALIEEARGTLDAQTEAFNQHIAARDVVKAAGAGTNNNYLAGE